MQALPSWAQPHTNQSIDSIRVQIHQPRLSNRSIPVHKQGARLRPVNRIEIDWVPEASDPVGEWANNEYGRLNRNRGFQAPKPFPYLFSFSLDRSHPSNRPPACPKWHDLFRLVPLLSIAGRRHAAGPS
jgi:hypothetical protein